MTLPGIPTTVAYAGTGFTTTEPAPILAWSPTVNEPKTLAPQATTTLLPIVGWRFPFSLPVPPKVTPWYKVTFLPIIVVSPMTIPEPWSINKPGPICAPGWISIPVKNLPK